MMKRTSGYMVLVLGVSCLLAAAPSCLLAADPGSLSQVSGWYAAGSNVIVTATPEAYSLFDSWSGETNDGVVMGNQFSFTVDGPRSITAVFTLKRTQTRAIPQEWLAFYGMTNYEVDVSQDQDRDGKTTWEEYLAGTDPTKSDSVFGVQSVQIVSNQLRVVWFGKPPESVATRFVMYQCTDLTENVWVAVDTNIVVDASGTNTWTAPYSGGNNGAVFYKPAFIVK